MLLHTDKMFVETIDAGGDEPLQVVSGLKGRIPLDELKGAK